MRSVDQERALDGLGDAELLALAAAEDRILVTANITHFPRIGRDWAEAGRSHAGVILVYGIDHGEFGLLRRGVGRVLSLYPQQDVWREHVVALDRAFAEG